MHNEIIDEINEKSSYIFVELSDYLKKANYPNADHKLAQLCELEYALTSIEHKNNPEDFIHLIK